MDLESLEITRSKKFYLVQERRLTHYRASYKIVKKMSGIKKNNDWVRFHNF